MTDISVTPKNYLPEFIEAGSLKWQTGFQEKKILLSNNEEEQSSRSQSSSSTSSDSLKRKRQTVDQVDTGYAWVICFVVCMLNITTDGFCFTLNVLFPIFLEKFGESTATTSLIGSVLTGVMLLSGPIIGYLISRFGGRLVCITGAAFAATGAVLSAMADSVLFLILSLGLLTGFGFGCIMMASMVNMMTWFDKHRPMALGITSIVGGCGMFIFPNLVSYLYEEFDLKGCFLILGGVILHCCVFALLLRPSPVPEARIPEKALEVGDSKKPNQFDFRILENWKYDIFLTSNLLYAIGYFPLMMFITLRAEQYSDISISQAAFLLTVVGTANILGRMVGTVLLSLSGRFINKILLTSTIELLGGLTIGLSVFCTDYASQMLFSVVYGLVGGFGMVSLGVVMAELVSVDQMAIASGFFTFSVGIAALSGGPLAGTILDFTGMNFTIVFLVMGFLVFCGGLLLLVIWIAQVRSTRNISKTPILLIQ